MVDDKNLLSIDADDDDISYLSLTKHLEDDSLRKKNKTASEFEELGGKYLEEIEKKKKKKRLKIKKLIPYILRHHKDIYDKEELLTYSFEDIQDIYNETKIEKKPTLIKFIQFIFNVE